MLSARHNKFSARKLSSDSNIITAFGLGGPNQTDSWFSNIHRQHLDYYYHPHNVAVPKVMRYNLGVLQANLTTGDVFTVSPLLGFIRQTLSLSGVNSTDK